MLYCGDLSDHDFKRAFWILGDQSLSAGANHTLRCSLRAWVVATPSTYSASLRFLGAHSLPRRSDLCCLCTLLTAARICRMAADCSHDSTPVVDDGRTSTHPVGRSLLAPSFRASA